MMLTSTQTIVGSLLMATMERLWNTPKIVGAVAVAFAIGIGIGGYLGASGYFSMKGSSKIDLSTIDITLKCLSGNSVEVARGDGSIDVLFPECAQELRIALGEEFREVGNESLRAILATVVAANFAEYGASSAWSYEDIKNSSHLNCGNTIFLVGYLLNAFDSENLQSIGFDGGLIGNHAQLLFRGNGETVLLDPTTGLIAKTNFNDLLRGVPLHESKIRTFSIKDKTKDINSFRERVYIAIRGGRYKPSDLMYMHGSLAEHKSKGGSSSYFTPGGITLRARLKVQHLASEAN